MIQKPTRVGVCRCSRKQTPEAAIRALRVRRDVVRGRVVGVLRPDGDAGCEFTPDTGERADEL